MCFYCSHDKDDSWKSSCQDCHELFEPNFEEHLLYWKLIEMEEQFISHKVIDPKIQEQFLMF